MNEVRLVVVNVMVLATLIGGSTEALAIACEEPGLSWGSFDPVFVQSDRRSPDSVRLRLSYEASRRLWESQIDQLFSAADPVAALSRFTSELDEVREQ
jgi:hypothetical protein